MLMKALEKLLSSPVTWYIGGAILLVIILKRWNILPESKTPTEKKAEAELEKRVQEIKNSGDIWTTQFWKGFPAKAYTDQQAQNLADHIRESFGFFDDDEAKIEGVFRTIKYQTNVSQIADRYTQSAKRDLHSDLIDKLSKGEMQNVYDLISRKPL